MEIDTRWFEFQAAEIQYATVRLPDTDGFLPPANELAGADVNTFVPTAGGVIIGVPKQERGIRPARALPYELNVHGTVDTVRSTLRLDFINTGDATVVFQVRSADATVAVRNYTVEPGKRLADTWSIASAYDLSVYGPNGFARFFKGSVGAKAATLHVHSSYGSEDGGELRWQIRNFGEHKVTVNVLDAYTGNQVTRQLRDDEEFNENVSLNALHGWYDLIVTVADDPTFNYRLAGHVETGRDSFSDPALGGLVTLKG